MGKKVKRAWRDVICLLSFYLFTFKYPFYLSKYFSTSACIFWNSGENW